MYPARATFARRETVLEEKRGSVIISAKQRPAIKRYAGALRTITSSMAYKNYSDGIWLKRPTV